MLNLLYQVIVQEVLTRIIDALNVHLKYYEHNSKDGRGFIISKLFSCLLEWLMVIEPMILSETELCQLVFDVIEYALHTSSVRIKKVIRRVIYMLINWYTGRRAREAFTTSTSHAFGYVKKEGTAIQVQAYH